MLSVTSVPARQGDAIWIQWGSPSAPYQMLIDFGTPATGELIHDRLKHCASNRRRFELVVITHIDSDHIGGAVTALANRKPLDGFDIGEFWFNGYQHLNGESEKPLALLESLGPEQGERLAAWLSDRSWNASFDGGAVCRIPTAAPRVVRLRGGLKLTILGPTPDRLAALSRTWTEEVHMAFALREEKPQVSSRLEVLGSGPASLESAKDLEQLANVSTPSDTSLANASSIVLLVEYEERALLFTGDAFAKDIVEAIEVISPNAPMRLDLVKLPHHGSKQNVSAALIASVMCQHWLISTDGTQFRHPDAEAIARIIQFSGVSSPEICFNVQSQFNEMWGRRDWKKRFNYSTRFGTPTEGISFSYA